MKNEGATNLPTAVTRYCWSEEETILRRALVDLLTADGYGLRLSARECARRLRSDRRATKASLDALVAAGRLSKRMESGSRQGDWQRWAPYRELVYWAAAL